MSDFDVRKAEFAAERFFETGAVRFCSAESALPLLLETLGLSAGDELIAASNMYSGISGFLKKSGVKAVYADVCENSTDVSAEDILSKLTERTGAVVVSYRFGRLSDTEALSRELCGRSVALVEEFADCAGAVRFSDGKILRPGNRGLSCIIEPEFALICAKDSGFAEKLPQSESVPAENFMKAMPYFEVRNGKRRLAAAHYRQLICEKGLLRFVSLPETDKNMFSSCPAFLLFAKERDALKDYLVSRGVLCALPQFCAENTFCGRFERIKDEMLLLPVSPELSFDAQKTAIDEIALFYRGQKR